MKNILLLLFLCTILNTSCQQSEITPVKYSLRDSVLKEHLNTVESLPYYDTAEINFKILKAYQNNDTTFLKSLRTQIAQEKEDVPSWLFGDSCLHQQKLQDMGVDEAYRFIYFPPFCTTPINVTVTRKGDSSNLHFVLYQNKYDTGACRIISEYDKKLTSNNWEEIKSKLRVADIWGLKRINGASGLDGNSLIFIGYQKGDVHFNRPDRYCYVYRWEFSTLGELLVAILKMSGNRKGCFWVT